jgi:hypothetical protein
VGVTVESISRDDLATRPILVGQDGFPGELAPDDTVRARQLIETTSATAVIVAAGAGAFWLVDATDQKAVDLGGDLAGTDDTDGFALGIGDGATLPGVPLDWDLLTFRCPHGDTTVLLALYPASLPTCPTHHVPLNLADTAS